MKTEPRRLKRPEETLPREGLASLRLSEIALTHGARQRSASGQMEWSTALRSIELQFADTPLRLVVQNDHQFNGKNPEHLSGDQYSFSLYDVAGRKGIYAECNLDFETQSGVVEAGTAVHREDQSAHIPKGAGRVLTERMMQLVADLASRYQTAVRHHLVRGLYISETPMTEQQWNSIFLPLIEAHGYHAVPDLPGEWVKDYLPAESAR